MKKIKEIRSNGYYLFESLSSGRSCYFENKVEVDLFKSLFHRYMNGYIKIHKMYLSTEGYRIILQIRGKEILIKRYVKSCEAAKKDVRSDFLEAVWRIVSERVRIFHSVYVKAVNKLRGRRGVLVQKRYERYVFDGMEEYEAYIEKMDEGEEIRGQMKKKYRVRKKWRKGVNWGYVRFVFWLESLLNRGFPDDVVEKLIVLTKSFLKPPP